MISIHKYIIIGIVFLYSNNTLGQQHQEKEYTFYNHQKYILDTVNGSYQKSHGWIKGYWRSISLGFFNITKDRIIVGRRTFKEHTKPDIKGTSSTKEKRTVAYRLKILKYQEGENYEPDKFHCDSKFGKLDVLIDNDKKYITLVKDSLHWIFHLDYENSSLMRLISTYTNVTTKTTGNRITTLDSLDVKPSYKGARTYEKSSALFISDIKGKLQNNPGIKDSCSISFSISKEGKIQNAQITSGGSKKFNDTLLNHLKYLQYWRTGFINNNQVEIILRFNIQIN